MAVIQCSCGKQLRVADEHAGKRVKCPACGQACVVPAAGAPKAPSLLSFHCSWCGQAMQARPEHAGRNTKCPACATVVAIPGQSDTSDKLTAQPPAARTAPDAARDDGDEASPRRERGARKVKRSPLPWIIAGVAALLLVVGGVVGGYVLFRSKTVADLDLIPGDAQGFAVVRVADALKDIETTKKALMAEGGRNLPPEMAMGLMIDPVSLVQQQTGINLNEIDRLTLVVDDLEKKIAWGLLSSTQPFNRDKILAAELFKQIKPQEIKEGNRTYHVVRGLGEPLAFCFLNDKLLAVGTEEGLKACLKLIGAKKRTGPLDHAIRRAGEKPTFLMAVNVKKVKETAPGAAQGIDKARREIPAEAAFLKPLLDAEAVHLISDQADQLLRMEVGLHLPDEASGQKAKEAIEQALLLGRTFLPKLKGEIAKEMPPQLADKLSQQIEQVLSTKPEQTGPNVALKVSMELPDVQQLALAVQKVQQAAVEKVRGSAKAVQHQNNLKQLVLAMHNYHDTYGRFPPAVIYSKDGNTPQYSWRVELLPFLEEGRLYQQFKKDEPWNSPNNIKLLSKMPKVFLLPGDPPNRNLTPYQVFVGQGTPWVGDGRKGLRLPEFQDGTSNTILIAEAASGVPWTKPDDMRLRPGISPLSQVGSKAFPDGFFAALADGSVKKVPLTIGKETLLNAINPADGNVLGPDWPN
jgi:flagellar basal body-associated protein FliL